MKRVVLSVLLLSFYLISFAQSEIGPEGNKLVWVFLILAALGIIFFIFKGKESKNTSPKRSFFSWQKVNIKLEKDKIYYPDNLTLTIKNSGNTDIDLDRPLLVFDNFWLKRKFRLNGTENRIFYPLFLEKGKTHVLNIDLYRFYTHDKKLKRYPKVKIAIFNVKGKQLGSRAIFLQKTLFKF